mmetsp:Transcript_11422/g.22764  ORF Transcript_11422/g.22764 Transcript_11422/m.22764 type:complete len:111 (+) Transcript_11422:1-333(+)
MDSMVDTPVLNEDELRKELGIVEEGARPSEDRARILRRWRAKRATLRFGRKVKYKKRRVVASTRERVGGRFVKTGTKGARPPPLRVPAQKFMADMILAAQAQGVVQQAAV